MVFVLPADEDQLRAKGYDKTPDFILQVPVGKSLSLMRICVQRGIFSHVLLLADVFRVTHLYNTMLKWVKLLEKIILNYILGVQKQPVPQHFSMYLRNEHAP